MTARASLVNDDGITFNSIDIAPPQVRHWATGREGNYTLYVSDGRVWRYVNGKKVYKNRKVAE